MNIANSVNRQTAVHRYLPNHAIQYNTMQYRFILQRRVNWCANYVNNSSNHESKLQLKFINIIYFIISKSVIKYNRYTKTIGLIYDFHRGRKWKTAWVETSWILTATMRMRPLPFIVCNAVLTSLHLGNTEAKRHLYVSIDILHGYTVFLCNNSMNLHRGPSLRNG